MCAGCTWQTSATWALNCASKAQAGLPSVAQKIGKDYGRNSAQTTAKIQSFLGGGLWSTLFCLAMHAVKVKSIKDIFLFERPPKTHIDVSTEQSSNSCAIYNITWWVIFVDRWKRLYTCFLFLCKKMWVTDDFCCMGDRGSTSYIEKLKAGSRSRITNYLYLIIWWERGGKEKTPATTDLRFLLLSCCW